MFFQFCRLPIVVTMLVQINVSHIIGNKKDSASIIIAY